MNINKITILGAGSWGTTLAILLSDKGFDVVLWEKFQDNCQSLIKNRENTKFLPGVKIPANIKIENNLKNACKQSEIIILAVPSHVLRELLKELKSYYFNDKILVSVIKGIENETLFRVSEVVKDILGTAPFVALSGPTHAEEVAKKIPSTIVASSCNPELSKVIQNIFVTDYFRVYTNDDLIGVELSGSLKNIIAIAAGISDGLGFGDNSKAALLTRGLAEITRLGAAMGAKPATFAGLTGMGDLITTCISKYSRNRQVGLHLATGEKLEQILKNMVMVAEGVKTTKSAYKLAEKFNIDMPITCEMYNVLFNDKAPRLAVRDLMMREYKSEN